MDTVSTEQSSAVAAALAEVASGEVRFDRGTRAAYPTDASDYRQVPKGVGDPLSPRGLPWTYIDVGVVRSSDAVVE